MFYENNKFSFRGGRPRHSPLRTETRQLYLRGSLIDLLNVKYNSPRIWVFTRRSKAFKKLGIEGHFPCKGW